MVGHGPCDGGLGDLGYEVVGHRVRGHKSYGHEEGVHGDGAREDDVHGNDVHEDDAHENGVHEDDAHEDGAHGDGVHEDGAHGDGAHWNYDYEGVRGFYWCQNGSDDILKEGMVEEVLVEMVVCLSDLCLLQEMGIQVYVSCGDGGNLWTHCS